MDWDGIERNWHDIGIKALQQWGLTFRELEAIGGRRDALRSTVANIYRKSDVEAEREIESWASRL